MRVSSFIHNFNPLSTESKKAVKDFKHLSIQKRILIVALTALTALATFFVLGLVAVPVFRHLVTNLTVKPSIEIPTKELLKDVLSKDKEIVFPTKELLKEDDDVIFEDVIPAIELLEDDDVIFEDKEIEVPTEWNLAKTDVPVKEEASVANKKVISLAKRWAFKAAPAIVPALKLPLNLLKTGATLNEAMGDYQKGETLSAVKKIAPLAIGGTMLAIGGPVVSVAFTALTIWSTCNLISDTVAEVRNYNMDSLQANQIEYDNPDYLAEEA